MSDSRLGPLFAVAAAAILLAPRAAPAQVFVTETLLAGDEAMGVFQSWAHRMNMQAQRNIRADKARDKLARARTAFRHGLAGLDREIERLLVNPEANKEQIAKLRKARDEAARVSDRLKRLGAIAADDKTMTNAIRSGTLERVANEAQGFFNGYKVAVESVRGYLATTRVDEAGLVAVRALEVYDGELILYMEDYVPGHGWTDVPIQPGTEIMIRKLPIVIRATIQDDQKKRLLDGRQKARNTEWHAVAGALPGQAFRYTSTSGESLWTANESYTWDVDRRYSRSADKIRGFSMQDSSRYAKGDILELHPLAGTAQNLEFSVRAAANSWHRESVLNGRKVSRDVEPKNGSASARLVISIFPK